MHAFTGKKMKKKKKVTTNEKLTEKILMANDDGLRWFYVINK